MGELPAHVRDPRRLAIVVVDKQRAYLDVAEPKPWLDPTGDAVADLVARIDRFVARARGLGARVVRTRMTESRERSPANIRACMASTGTPTLSEPGSSSFDWVGAHPEPGDLVIDKPFYDAFAGTDLAAALGSSPVDAVVLLGAFAGRCVLATGFGANGHGHLVVLVPDLTMAHPADPAEMTAVANIVGGILGWVIPSHDLLQGWAEPA